MYGFLIAILKEKGARVNNLRYIKDNDISVNLKELLNKRRPYPRHNLLSLVC